MAQQIFWYTAFTASMVAPKSAGNNTVDDKGNPLWRMAPSPHGPYWEEGMKLGYQDAGSWTLFKSTPLDRRKAAWLYAQFTISKTVDVKKSHVGLTFIRDTTIRHKSFTDRAPKLGGLVEFYRSPDRVMWTPTGINVPDYPKLAQLWWQHIGDVNSGAFTPQQAMDRLAKEMDQVMARMEEADKKDKVYGGCGPRLNPEKDPNEWLGKPNGPKAKLENEKPQGRRSTTTSWSSAGPSARRCRSIRQAAIGRGASGSPSASVAATRSRGLTAGLTRDAGPSRTSSAASARRRTSTRRASSSSRAASTRFSARRSPARPR